MALKTLLLVLVTALAGTMAADFSGNGQLRTLGLLPDPVDLGCLTNEGKWTTDEAKCGTFVAFLFDEVNFNLSTPTGACGMPWWGDGNTYLFKCGMAEGQIFAKYLGDKPGQSPIPGRDILRYVTAYAWSTSGPSPPAPSDEPLEIHMWRGSSKDKGRPIALAWKSLA